MKNYVITDASIYYDIEWYSFFDSHLYDMNNIILQLYKFSIEQSKRFDRGGEVKSVRQRFVEYAIRPLLLFKRNNLTVQYCRKYKQCVWWSSVLSCRERSKRSADKCCCGSSVSGGWSVCTYQLRTHIFFSDGPVR